MKKVLFDTNIWLRLFTDESSTQQEGAKKIITQVEQGKLLPYISNIILLEIAYTLKTFYKIKPNRVAEYLNTILQTRNLNIIEKTDSRKAYELFRKTRIKFTDCLIATQIKPGMKIITYDRDFVKLIPKQIAAPEDAVN